MSIFVEGRRVADYEAIECEGDYYVGYAEDGGIASVVFATPGFRDYQGELSMNVITGPAAEPERPRWEVSEDADGKITASPSFLAMWRERGVDRRFHCYLKGGVFELLDDCVGALLPD